ncbi:alpha/beta-hydrolase [Myriangium duriaei CBS 260.36]|uniref:Alpha/beta-hydrolase n=1 Tax=Myriangium duriaei CBS 260.36 TaxID=1168546 RepID=A0A9P4J914_9PEZI|nr:alpha/beta-hydrolase [Myriangium duriaei CBS 260.36]
MRFSAIQLGLLVAGSNYAAAQFVPAPTDLTTKTGSANVQVRYKQVPNGVCELDPKVKSYSGYADVGQDEHIFWWFFEARGQDATKAPLTVWINGGPGSSSMIGLFQENGPCRLDANGKIVSNPYSWSNLTNMLFIDQPVGTGFSYGKAIPAITQPNNDIIQLPSNNCPDYAAGLCSTASAGDVSLTANSTSAAAPNFWKTLQGFMGAFPQYSRNDFHFATESYGGHYGPVFNTYIEQQNALIQKKSIQGQVINLKTVMIGNGWYDPLIQYAAHYNFTVSPGNTYDYSPYNKSISNMVYNNMYGKGNCYDQIVNCQKTRRNDVCYAADTFCANEVESALDNYAARDEYDIRELTPDPFPSFAFAQYLNTPKVQSALGAFVNYTFGSNTVTVAFGNTGDDARTDGTIQDMQTLISSNVTVVMYFGDADYNCNWLGGQAVANEINAPGFSSAGFANISTSDNIVHGQVKQSGAFSFVRVYDAGHEVPFYQPVTSLAMLQRAMTAKDIATGKVSVAPGSSYKSQGSATSTFREGKSTVQMSVLPADATYNTTTNAPNVVKKSAKSNKASLHKMMSRRNVVNKPL